MPHDDLLLDGLVEVDRTSDADRAWTDWAVERIEARSAAPGE